MERVVLVDRVLAGQDAPALAGHDLLEGAHVVFGRAKRRRPGELRLEHLAHVEQIRGEIFGR